MTTPITKRKGGWCCFPLDTNEDEAAAKFVARFGHHPDRIDDKTPMGEDRGGPVVKVLALGPVCETLGKSEGSD